MFKPLGFISSVIVSILLVVAGAALASTLERNGSGSADLATASASAEQESAERGNPDRAQTAKLEGKAAGAHLSVKVSGIRSANGKLLVMVFDNSDAFTAYDHNRAVGYQELSAQTDSMMFDFASLKEGPYAVFVMHDENSDYQLNEQDGYPVEGFVISGARSKYDEPSFTQAAVAQGALQLELEYF
ncbi:MAG: DUF2141 domain-containing protein [Pseudomonadota bacterium]